jgi:hypothetical protein
MSTALVLSLAMLTTANIWAKPNIQPLGPNIADTKSQYYDFKIKKFTSKDQKRTYKVWLGVPKNTAQHAKAALFMLDGNAVMDRLQETTLMRLSQHDAPVLVAIGYDSHLPFVTDARSIDYTPSDASGKIQADPRNLERLSGGSQAFADLIITEIQPWVMQQTKLDSKRIGIWGHSYGGLFVLDTLVEKNAFNHYFAASPSLIWANARMLKKILSVQVPQAAQKTLWLMEGDINPQTEQKSRNSQPNTIQHLSTVAQHLQQQNLHTRVVLYPNLSHGEVFNAALHDVLRYGLNN